MELTGLKPTVPWPSLYTLLHFEDLNGVVVLNCPGLFAETQYQLYERMEK